MSDDDKQGSTNTSQIARELSQSEIGKTLGLTVNKSLALIEQLGGQIVAQLAQGNTVHWHRFGNFKVLDTAARKGRNPRTGDDIQIPAGKRAHFVVSQHMKEAVSQGKVPATKARKAAAAKPAAKKAAAKAKGFKPGAKEDAAQSDAI